MHFTLGCDNTKIDDPQQCPALGEKGNNYSATSDAELNEDENKYNATDLTQDTHKISIPASSRINDRKLNLNDNDSNQLSLINNKEQEADGSTGTLLGFLIPIGLVLAIVCWVSYAYRNPHTKSGQLLIQVRF